MPPQLLVRLLLRLPQPLVPQGPQLAEDHPVGLVLQVDRAKVVRLRPLMLLTKDTPTVVVDEGISGRFGRRSG
jgi:hypothetical protein